MRVLALTFGGIDCASTFYRVLQYARLFQQDNIFIEQVVGNVENIPSASCIKKYDVVLVQKKLLPRKLVVFLRKHSRRLVFDIDDATWHPHARKHSFFTRLRTNLRLRSISESADICTAPNFFILDNLQKNGAIVTKIPMAIESNIWSPAQKIPNRKISIGWAGAPSNLPYLESIESALRDILLKFPQSELVILCGQRPNFASKLPFTHITWKPNCESKIVPRFDIGLLPLSFSEFSNGKSPIKALQYLASGLPVVASPLSGTLEIAEVAKSIFFANSNEEWFQILSILIKSEKLRHEASFQSKSTFDKYFSCSAVYPFWKKALLGIDN